MLHLRNIRLSSKQSDIFEWCGRIIMLAYDRTLSTNADIAGTMTRWINIGLKQLDSMSVKSFASSQLSWLVDICILTAWHQTKPFAWFT